MLTFDEQNEPLSEQIAHSAGRDCECGARSEGECGCDVDWTDSEVYKLRKQLEKAKAMLSDKQLIDLEK